MPLRLLAAVAAVIAIGYTLAHLHRSALTSWFLVRTWRWLTGEAHHGNPITDAGWFRRGQRALTRTGHATRWWHLPRWKRTAVRTGGTLALVAILWGRLAYPQATDVILAALLLGLLVLAGWRVWVAVNGRRHRRTWLHPLHLAAHDLAGIPRAQAAASWITAELDGGGAVRRAELSLPQGWPADEKDKQRLIAVTSAKLGIEAAEPSWRLAGPKPQLILAHSEPPPPHVAFADLLDDMARCREDELLLGVGKKSGLIKASLSTDSPHIAISMGTGAGKSNLAGWLLLQILLRGGIGLVLDAKRGLSYPWILKDGDSEMAQLPNVGYARTTDQMHRSMTWLSDELNRRNGVALAGMDTTGKVRANVGPRLFVIAEELNMAIPRLRAHWAEMGGTGKSPAFTGLGEVAFAGRQVHMHLIIIGQMLTAEATGSRDSSVKENCGIKMLSRYGPKGWRIMADDIPMPPSPEAMGRIQAITGRGVRETQTPEMAPVEARRMVLASDMAALPSGMPCQAPRPVTASVPALVSGSDLGRETVTGGPAVSPGGPDRVTIGEAVRLGLVHPATTVGALRMARFRDPDFPARAGARGSEYEYDTAALVAYDLARRA